MVPFVSDRQQLNGNAELHLDLLTNRVSMGGNGIDSVRPSIHLFLPHLSYRLIFYLDLLNMCGSRPQGLKVKVRGQAKGLSSKCGWWDLDPPSRTAF